MPVAESPFHVVLPKDSGVVLTTLHVGLWSLSSSENFQRVGSWEVRKSSNNRRLTNKFSVFFSLTYSSVKGGHR